MAIPYYEAPAPLIPKEQMLVPQLIMEGGRQGMQMFMQSQQNKQRYNLEQQQMLQQAALAEKGFEVQRENNALDFQIQWGQLQSQKELNAAHAALYNEQTNLYKKGLIGNAVNRVEIARTEADFNQRVNELNLLDPNPKNPVEYYANFQKLHDEFALADVPKVKQSLAQLKARTEQHTIPIYEFDPETKERKGSPKNVSVGQLMQNLNDPVKADTTKEVLRLNGMWQPEKTESKLGTAADQELPFVKRDFVMDWIRGEKTITKTPSKALGTFQPYADMGRGVDFSRSKPRTPAAGIAPTEGSLFEPTETQRMIEQAKRAKAIPGADLEGIRAYLAQKGIDPTEAGL